MPTGTVKDDGDPGMKGQRIGLIKPDNGGNLLPFNNDIDAMQGDRVEYEVSSLGGWTIAVDVRKLE